MTTTKIRIMFSVSDTYYRKYVDSLNNFLKKLESIEVRDSVIIEENEPRIVKIIEEEMGMHTPTENEIEIPIEEMSMVVTA